MGMFAEPTTRAPEFSRLGLTADGDAKAWALFSADRRYRYLLGRSWDAHAPVLVAGMLNPSIAGAYNADGSEQNDPTVRKLIGFARRRQCGGLIVCNTGAFIATDPKDFAKADDPIGPLNEDAIRIAFKGPLMAVRVAAWGGPLPKRLFERVKGSMAWMRQCGARWCWGTTKAGEPRHPLMLAYDTPLVSLVDGRPFP